MSLKVRYLRRISSISVHTKRALRAKDVSLHIPIFKKVTSMSVHTIHSYLLEDNSIARRYKKVVLCCCQYLDANIVFLVHAYCVNIKYVVLGPGQG